MKKILLVCLLSSLWLTACGQKGPLYLPLDRLDQPGQERIKQLVEVSSIEGSGTGFIETPVDLS